MLAKNFYDFAPHCTSCPRLPTIHVEVFISLRRERNLRDTSCFCCPQGAHGNNGRFQPTGGCAVDIDCWHVRHAYSDLLFQYMFIIVYPRGGSVFVDANGTRDFKGCCLEACHDPTSMWLCRLQWMGLDSRHEVHDRNQTTCGERTSFFKFCEHKCWILSTFASFICLFLWFCHPAGGWLCGMLGCRHLWWRLASGRPATHPHHSLHGADIRVESSLGVALDKCRGPLERQQGYRFPVSRYVKHIFSWVFSELSWVIS